MLWGSICCVFVLHVLLQLLCTHCVLNVILCVHVLCGFAQDSQSKQGGYSMHQLQGNKEFGSEKKGYLLKKSDGWAANTAVI